MVPRFRASKSPSKACVAQLMRINLVIMKTVVLGLLLILVLASEASAILRPRVPRRPAPPYGGQIIIIVDEMVAKRSVHPFPGRR